MPSAALAAVPESPSPSSCYRGRRRSPLRAANGGDFAIRHWRAPLKQAPSCRGPPEIEIPVDGGGDVGDGGRRGYTSLRDILSSPRAGSPAGACGGGCFGGVGGIGGGGSCGDIDTIRHPLVKHAAYAYLQMTPSAMEDPARRSRRWRRGPLCRLLLDCLSFIGALFRR